MTTNPCPHPTFGTQVDITRTELAWMADIRITCIACDEPFRFPGLNVGVSLGYPTVSMDGIELRAPIEPLSAHKAREAKIPGAYRYALEVRRFQQSSPAVGMQEVTELVAHDQWHLGAGCAEAIAAIENPTFKPGIPYLYHACERCKAAERIEDLNAVRSDLVGEPPAPQEMRALNAAAAAQAREEAVKGSTFGQAIDDELRAAGVIPSSTPVIPLEPDDGDEDEEEGTDTAADQSEPGQPAVHATAAILILPEGGAGSTAAGEDEQHTVGQVVPRPRPAPRGGRQRGGE